MAVVVQDLVTKFSFLGSTAPLTDYNQTLGGSIKLLGGMVLGLEAAAGVFAFWADGVLTGVDALDQLHNISGVAVSDLQELNFVAGQTQSSSAAMESTIRSLGNTIGSAAQKGSEDFARLGISVRDASGQVKNADVVLDEVRQRFQALGLSVQEQEHFASALGIDSSLLQLMGKTNSEMAAMRDRARELGTLTAEQTEQADLYKKSLNEMWFGLNSVKQLVAVGVAPQLSIMAENFTQLLADNKDWIVDGIQFTVEWVGNLLAALHRLLPVFALMGAGFFAMKIAALGFAGAIGLVFSPVVLIAAAVVAFLVIMDDLIVAMDGGKSVIADFFQEFFGVDIVPVLNGVVGFVSDTIGIIIGLWTDVGDAMQDVFGGIGKLLSGDIVGAIDDILGAFITLGASVYDRVFAPLFDLIGSLVAGLLPDWALELIGADRSAAGTTAPSTIPMGAATSTVANMTDNRSIEQNITNNISTNDPEAAGRSVGNNLQRQLDNANTQLDVGGI